MRNSTAYICTGWLVFAIGAVSGEPLLMLCSTVLFIAGAICSND